MFRKEEYKINSFSVFRLTDETGVFADIIPELGAMVHQIGMTDKRGNILTILESDSPEELHRNPWFRGRILFPFNDRIPRGKYSFNGADYQLPINSDEDGSAIHGLVYNRPFAVKNVEAEKEFGRMTLVHSISETDFDSYPFSVDLSITYTLKHNEFSISYEIFNRGDRVAPVALGWHPYFSLSEKVDLLKLQAGGGDYVAVDESLNPTGEVLPVTGSPFNFTDLKSIGSEVLDIAFNLPEQGRTVMEDKDNRIEIVFDTDLFPYVQLFTPPGRNSIAVEPITAATNSFNIDGLGRIDLTSGEQRSGTVKISLNHFS